MNTTIIIDSRYRLGEMIGKGGMGVIYKAFDLKLNDRPCAIKILNNQSVENKKRFNSEIEIISKIKNPHVVSILDAGHLGDGQAYLVMELLEGSPLSSLFNDPSHSFSWQDALSITQDLLAGLSTAHELKVIHRDLKPANLFLVSTKGENFLKILDFGIAKSISVDPAKDVLEDHTALNQVIGTTKYMAPEQFLGKDLDERTDLYAVGLILYEMLKDEYIYSSYLSDSKLRGLSPHQKYASAHLTAQPEMIPNISEELWLWLKMCFAKSQDDRHPDTSTALERLNNIIEQGNTNTEPSVILSTANRELIMRSYQEPQVSMEYYGVKSEANVNRSLSEFDSSINQATQHKRHWFTIALFVLSLTIISVLMLSTREITIRLTPYRDTISASTLVDIGNSTSSGGAVFTKSFKYKEVFKVKNLKEIESRAGGEMRVINNSTRSITLVPRTRFLSDNSVIYRTVKRVRVPARQSRKVVVKADIKGARGNIPQGKFTIPGLSRSRQSKIYGKSTGPMIGGVRVAGILTEADQSQAKRDARDHLKQKYLSQYMQRVKDSDNVNSIIELNISEEDIRGSVGDEVNVFSIYIKGEVNVLFFKREKLDKVTQESLSKMTPDGLKVGEMTDLIVEVNSTNKRTHTATLKGTRSASVSTDLNCAQLQPLRLVGMTKDEIKRYLASLTIIESYDIESWPWWMSTSPSDPSDIVIHLQ